MASSNALVPALNSALVLAFSAGAASAHISLDQASTHKSRYGDGDQKIAPCGRANGERSDNVYEYAAGETITVEFKEFIPHPGYFRFAFDADGHDDFVDPVSIKPIDPNRACPFNPADKCGTSDFYNNDAVLPGMDNLEPHLAQDSKGTYSFEVKLPDVECDNCTLQLIQVMEDTIHGAYNTVLDDPADDGPFAGVPDVYHLCIDLKLTRPPGSGAAAEDDSGCSVNGGPATGTAGVLLALGLVGLIGVRRRR